MSNIYLCSDAHFNHSKNFLFEPRGFSSIEEHDNQIIKNWNEIVKPEDEVYFLGDFCLCGGDKEKIKNAVDQINQLNGTIYWIRGNHDTENMMNIICAECPNVFCIGWSMMLKYHKYHFYLSHYPTLCSNYDENMPLKTRVISLCGHSHTKDKWQDWDKGIIYHCELDCQDNKPKLIDEIIEECKEKYNENRVYGL